MTTLAGLLELRDRKVAAAAERAARRDRKDDEAFLRGTAAWVAREAKADEPAERIIVRRTADGYSATFSDEDGRIFGLFGTTTIPTPFTPEADIADVVAEVRRRNPGAIVTYPSDTPAYREFGRRPHVHGIAEDGFTNVQAEHDAWIARGDEPCIFCGLTADEDAR